MNDARFDRLARRLSGLVTRRRALAGLFGAALLPLAHPPGDGADARERKRRKGPGTPARAEPAARPPSGGEGERAQRCAANNRPCARGAACCSRVCARRAGAKCTAKRNGKQRLTGKCRCGPIAAKPLGQPCAGAAECVSGFCVDGVCCESTCDGFPNSACGAGGVCGCVPSGCGDRNCGSIDDGCGATVNCPDPARPPGACAGATPICSAANTCVGCSAARPCPAGCCANDGSCQPGTARGACGRTGGSCAVCPALPVTCLGGGCCTVEGATATASAPCCPGLVRCGNEVCRVEGNCCNGVVCGNGRECSGGACALRPGCDPKDFPADCVTDLICCSNDCSRAGVCQCSRPGTRCLTTSDCCQNAGPQSCVGFTCRAA